MKKKAKILHHSDGDYVPLEEKNHWKRSYQTLLDASNKQLEEKQNLLEEAMEVIKFYADGAGLEIIDEGRNFSSHHVAYENDYNGVLTNCDKQVGYKAKEFLERVGK